MRIRVLGTVSVSDPTGRAVARPERKARELLTVLVLRAPTAATIDELADLLWDDPPESAVKTIRSHISRLRTALQTAGIEDGIEPAGSTGYRLVVAPGTTDVDSVSGHRHRARQLIADGRTDSAASLLASARSLWTGDPELPDTTTGIALARGWRREHRQLTLEHLRCVVDGSDPSQALGELERSVATNPTDEPMCVLHVQALQRSGHHTEAVRAVSAARAALAELGLDIGNELRGVEADVFAGPTRHAATTTTPSTSDRVETPVIDYAVVEGRHTAYTVLSSGQQDLVVLNPAMITIDGLLDEPHARHALARLGAHARVVCLDRRGIGLTDPLDPRREALDEWTDDITHVLDALDIDAAHLLANLDTGLIALAFAARHPERVRSLVLAHCFASSHRRDGYPYGVDSTIAHQLIRDFVTPGSRSRQIETEYHMAPTVAGDDEFVRWWTRTGERAASPGTASTIHTIALQTDMRDRLASLAAPTLVIHRRGCLNVELGHARYLTEHLPNAELAIVPGTDALWFTDTADLLDKAIEFLHADRCPASPGRAEH